MLKILVAVDGSRYTARMLEFLASHDMWFQSAHVYTVIHVVLAVPPRAASFVDAATVESYHETDAAEVFAPVSARLEANGIKASLVYKVGHAAEAIAEYADAEHFDLIVMGSSGHGEVMNLVIGSVTTGVLAKCRIPVMVVR